MAHYMQFAPTFEPRLLERILPLGIKNNNDDVVIQVLSAASRRYKEAPQGLIDTIFMPAIRYFAAKDDARWINLVWYLRGEQSFLSDLTADQAATVLGSLVHLREIDTHAEFVLLDLAVRHQEKVFDFFGARLRFAGSRDEDANERYVAVPFRFFELQKSFAKITEHAVGFVRKLFVPDDPMFQHQGGRLLASGFPDFAPPFAETLKAYLQSGNRDDIDYVIQVLSSYHGDVSLTTMCRAVIGRLSADDALLSDVEIVLQNIGTVSGEFGLVQAYQAQKQEMAGWLRDPDEKIRAFAEGYVRMLDRQIAGEQRRSEEGLEMRKRITAIRIPVTRRDGCECNVRNIRRQP
ncbi:MAG TPA: hypothetical protein VMV19_06045 [Xanthobacteraceae bacterium]|nr:hypothetical protein [Xanthobacteraceae bacterium]